MRGLLSRLRFRGAWWADAKEAHAWLSNYQFGFRLAVCVSLALHSFDALVLRSPLLDGMVLRQIHDDEDGV